ncbi:be7a20b7-18c1-4359-8ea4-7f6e6637e248 [Sclerotinia trifoliorum]|uniref:Be7a20b7-18c1-4359-8ea4-7f6e6637e248 n=1 Tax=Sclerotinia trifoliorum TaxID=28548 RepID=A0A8H2ZT26_9HELO|nr:be7a20b7-18c1-4359-8ea4-7f6e6637e248 [Sclerotinia trifoliorum]
MEDEMFHFEEDDDEYQTSDDEYSDEFESQPWDRSNRRNRIAKSEEQALRDIPADVFLSTIDLSSGPTVKIFLGAAGDGLKLQEQQQQQQALILPKTLLCTHSAFFNQAFNGNGNGNEDMKESLSLPQELHLPGTSLTVFQLIIQFLSTNTFTFPLTITSPSEKQTLYLHFFTLYQTLHIRTPPLTPILTHFKTHLRHSSIQGKFPSRTDIQKALQLPRSHEARKLCIAACVKPYAYSITKSSTCYGRALFHLEGLMEESDEFAAELVRGYTKAVRGALGAHTIVDPLTAAPYVISTGVECLREGGETRGRRCASHLEGL